MNEPTLCVICAPKRETQSRDGGVTCWSCHERLGDVLREIVKRYHALDATPGVAASTERRAPGFRSIPPLNLHVVALADPRTRVVEKGDPACAQRVYSEWANRIRRERRQRTIRQIIDLDRDYLTNSMDWITRQSWVSEFAEEIERVCAQLRSATGDPNPKPVGWCIELIEVEGAVKYCGHPLFPPRQRGAQALECAGCGTTYDLLRQARMALAREQGPPVPPCACGHDGPQHNPAAEARPCNVRWCGCVKYRPPTETETVA